MALLLWRAKATEPRPRRSEPPPLAFDLGPVGFMRQADFVLGDGDRSRDTWMLAEGVSQYALEAAARYPALTDALHALRRDAADARALEIAEECLRALCAHASGQAIAAADACAFSAAEMEGRLTELCRAWTRLAEELRRLMRLLQSNADQGAPFSARLAPEAAWRWRIVAQAASELGPDAAADDEILRKAG